MIPLGFEVRRTTTAQQVAEGLSDLIMAGQFQPGARLRESLIAKDLGVARSTVREAVRILELGGLVEFHANKGAVVISPTASSVQTLYSARARLEIAAAQHSATGADLAPVHRALERLREAAKAEDIPQIVTADLEFHAAIVSLLESTRIDDFYTQLTVELRYYLTVLSVEDRDFTRPEAVVQEHEVILDALETRDVTLTAQAIAHHIDYNGTRVCQIVEERRLASS